MSDRRDPQLPLGLAIKAIREEQRLGREKVAARAGLSDRWLADVEAGRSNPTWGNLRRIAAGLGVPLPELMGRVEEFEQDA
jgi:transcriptional regulator with XRE-family HTH domain